MFQFEIDGTMAAEAAARRAIADSKGEGIALVGVVRTSRFEAPSPAVGDKIRRFQRVETQLLRLAREANAAGVPVSIALPGHEPALPRERERIALRPAAA
jgi:hypothetical protein